MISFNQVMINVQEEFTGADSQEEEEEEQQQQTRDIMSFFTFIWVLTDVS